MKMKKELKISSTSKHFSKIAEDILDKNLMSAKEIERELTRLYFSASSEITNQVDRIFFSYMKKYDLTVEDAMKILKSNISFDERNNLLNNVFKVKNPAIREQMLARLNKDAYLYRMTNRELIKEQIQLNFMLVAEEEEKLGGDFLKGIIPKTFYLNCFEIQKKLGYRIIYDDSQKLINTIMTRNWQGSNFSKRVWKNCDELASRMSDVITKSVLAGTDERKLVKYVRDLCNDVNNLSQEGLRASKRLIRTECAFVTNEAQFQSMKEEGFEYYIFLSCIDSRTSKKCREYYRRKFPLKDKEVGVNFPPMHPNCRSTTAGYVDRDFLNYRSEKEKLGDNVVVDDIIDYEQWYQTYVK